MKYATAPFLPIALAAAAAAPLTAGSTPAHLVPSVDPTLITGARTSVALDVIDDLIDAGKPIDHALEELSAALADLPSASALRGRLQGYVDDLADAAGSTFLTNQHAAELRLKFVDARLDELMEKLEVRAKGGDWSEEQIQSVLDRWVARSNVFVDAPDPAAYRARYQAAVDKARSNATRVMGYVREMRLTLLRMRIEEAREFLLQRVADTGATRADFNRLMELVIRRARLADEQPFPA